MHGMSLSGFSWVPLASVTESSEVAKGIISKLRKRIEDKAKAGLLPPGLKEQYDLQLEELEMRGYGDCEIIHFPSYFGSVGGKSKRTFFSGSMHENEIPISSGGWESLYICGRITQPSIQ